MIRNKSITFSLLAVAASFLVSGCGSNDKPGVVAAIQPVESKAAFNPVWEHGNLRITLLSVARVNSFVDPSVEYESGNLQKRAQVPGIELRYMAERIDDAPVGALTIGTDDCFDGGKIAKRVPGAAIHRIFSVTKSLQEVDSDTDIKYPKVADPKRSIFRMVYLGGIIIESEHVDIEIEAGFGEMQTVWFKNVPLNSN